MENNAVQELLGQASVLMDNAQYDIALEYLRKAEQEDKQQVDVYIQEGICLVNLDRIEDAEKAVKKALYVDKHCGEAYFHLACMAGLREDMQQAIKYVDMAKINGYENAQLYFTLGMMYEEQNDINTALRNYNKALDMEPIRPDIHMQKCNLLINANRWEGALESASDMIKGCPDYFEGYHFKCQILVQLDRFEEARKVLDEGLEKFPDEAGFKLDRAKILVFENKLDEAEEQLKELENNAGEWYRSVLLEEARVYGIQNDYERTKSVLERAYKECKEDGHADGEITYLLMSVYMAEKHYEEVIPMAQTLVDLGENGTYINVAQFYKAEALDKLGNREEAKTEFENTIRRCRAAALENPAAVDAYMLRALALSRLGRNEEALEMVDYVVSLAPDTAEVHSAKAMILKELGRVEEMKKELEIIAKIGGELSAVMSNLA